VLNPPFSAQAQLSGLRSLGRLVDVLGPYQAGGAFVLRPWAKAHGGELEAYMAAYIEALRWLRDDANGEAVEGMLAHKLALAPALASATRRDLLAPDFGFTVDAAFNAAGFDAVLSARAELQGEDSSLRDGRALVDQSYYARALASVNG
jgi:ABC-type nitrate/sulfonate/bicarbonate transport system substrate-binding protein